MSLRREWPLVTFKWKAQLCRFDLPIWFQVTTSLKRRRQTAPATMLFRGSLVFCCRILLHSRPPIFGIHAWNVADLRLVRSRFLLLFLSFFRWSTKTSYDGHLSIMNNQNQVRRFDEFIAVSTSLRAINSKWYNLLSNFFAFLLCREVFHDSDWTTFPFLILMFIDLI